MNIASYSLSLPNGVKIIDPDKWTGFQALLITHLWRELIACILVTKIPICQTVNIPSVLPWDSKVKRRCLCLRFFEVWFLHFMPKQKRNLSAHCKAQLSFTKKNTHNFINFKSAKLTNKLFPRHELNNIFPWCNKICLLKDLFRKTSSEIDILKGQYWCK